MSKPTLSVIIPNYNDAAYIGVALKAILTQSFQPTEVIIVDDGSTDNSVEVIEAFSRKHPCITFLRNERNQGSIFSANRGLQAASGDYTYFASANDLVLPGFFEKSMSVLQQYPRAGLCCSDPAILDRSGRIMGRALGWAQEPCYLSPEKLVDVMNWNRFIWGFSVLVKRSAYQEAGSLLAALRWSCDWYTINVVGFRCGICYVPEPLAASRTHEGSYSSGMLSRTLQREVNEYVLTLLKSPAYRDVLPLFQRSGVLSYLPGMVPLLVSNAKYWDCLSPSLLPRLLQASIRGFLSRITPRAAKDMYRRVRYKTIELD